MRKLAGVGTCSTSTKQKKFSVPLLSSIIVGCLWGLWHTNYAGDITFWLLFIVLKMEFSILLTFLLHKADGDLWTAIIFHTIFNFTARVFFWEQFTITLIIISIVLFGLACAIVMLLDNKWMIKKPV